MTKAKAGHIGGITTVERYGAAHMAMIGKLGGRPKLPTIEQLRVEAASKANQITGGERLPNSISDLSLTGLKKLYKLELLRRGRLLPQHSP